MKTTMIEFEGLLDTFEKTIHTKNIKNVLNLLYSELSK